VYWCFILLTFFITLLYVTLGVTLSGGQKARLSLARVAYSRPDVAILDDPLSALDAGTSKKVFERLCKPTAPGLFANTAVVLVTHASHFLKRVDSLLVLVNGRSVFVGEWGDLASCHPTDPNELDAIESIRSSVQEEVNDDSDLSHTPSPTTQHISLDSTEHRDATQLNVEKGRIMTQEERKYGLSQMSTWASWFSYAGGWTFFIVFVITMTLDRYLYVAIELWIGKSCAPLKCYQRSFCISLNIYRSSCVDARGLRLGLQARSVVSTTDRRDRRSA
jgi:hypothetical protein